MTLSVLVLIGCRRIDKSKTNNEYQENDLDTVEVVSAVDDAEQARLEEARQDSIRKAEEEKANRLSINTFCQWKSSERVMTISNLSNVATKLKNLGFKEIRDKMVWEGENECFGIYEKTHEALYERDEYGYDIRVKLSYSTSSEGTDLWEVKIDFPNSELKNDFIISATKNHFRKISGKEYSAHPEDIYWMGSEFSVSGNTITLRKITGY